MRELLLSYLSNIGFEEINYKQYKHSPSVEESIVISLIKNGPVIVFEYIIDFG